MRWYSLPGWPARVLGHSAAMPNMARPPGSAMQYKDGITGRPGTAKVMNGNPSVPGGPITRQLGGFSFTSNCPGFYPNLYYARPEKGYWPGAGMPISVQSDNLMPVPATDPRGVPAPMAFPLSLRGVKQIRQPATLVVWPNAGAQIYE